MAGEQASNKAHSLHSKEYNDVKFLVCFEDIVVKPA